MGKDFKQWSKDNWSTVGKNQPSSEQITVGCLQRIADATEVMAQNYAAIIRAKESAEKDAKRYYEWYRQSQQDVAKRDRQISALKGVITKLKNK